MSGHHSCGHKESCGVSGVGNGAKPETVKSIRGDVKPIPILMRKLKSFQFWQT